MNGAHERDTEKWDADEWDTVQPHPGWFDVVEHRV